MGTIPNRSCNQKGEAITASPFSLITNKNKITKQYLANGIFYPSQETQSGSIAAAAISPLKTDSVLV